MEENNSCEIGQLVWNWFVIGLGVFVNEEDKEILIQILFLSIIIYTSKNSNNEENGYF